MILGGLAAWQGPGLLAKDAPTTSCQQSTLPVNLSVDDPTAYHVTGWLCAKGAAAGKPVQLLLSGLTYDHTYWDAQYQPDTYSYVRAATDAGYATFNIDRLGVGLSDKPPAAKVTVATEGYATHQIVQALRQGKVDGTQFSTVIGVGHSLGAAIWIYEAGSFTDVDGLVLADYLHQPNVAQQMSIATTIYPAENDPRFAGKGLPTGYFTTKPGTRAADFYNKSYADPAAVSQDEALKQTATSGERATLNLARDPKYSKAIRVPTLLVVGAQDALNCGPAGTALSCADSTAVLSREKADYAPQACLTAEVLPGAGHDTNLHLNAHQWFAAAGDWATRRIGADPNHRPAQSCPSANQV